MTDDNVEPPESMTSSQIMLWAGQITQWIKGANGSFASAAKHFADIEDMLRTITDHLERHTREDTELHKKVIDQLAHDDKCIDEMKEKIDKLFRTRKSRRWWSVLVREGIIPIAPWIVTGKLSIFSCMSF